MNQRAALRAVALAAVLAFVMGAMAGAAQTSSESQGATSASAKATHPPRITAVDRNFVVFAASSGVLEVDASRLALDRSNNAEVRGFAQRMVDEHAKANEELKSVAKTLGLLEEASVTLPKHSAALDRLRALNGFEFDREYAAQVGVASHLETVAVFDKGARELGQPSLKALASKRLPELREHLKEGQALARAVAVPMERMKEANAAVDVNLRAGFLGATTGSANTTPTNEAEPPGRGPRAGGGTGGTASGSRTRSPTGPSSGTAGAGKGGSGSTVSSPSPPGG